MPKWTICRGQKLRKIFTETVDFVRLTDLDHRSSHNRTFDNTP